MAGEFDNLDGRKPSIGYGKGGPYVRGFRSRPGAPQHDPTSNEPMSRDSRTPQSNWDRMFRDTQSNSFGAAGANPSYISGFAAPEQPSIIDRLGYDPGGTAQLEAMFSGGMSHAQEWSQPAKPRAFASTTWEAPSQSQSNSILDRYQTKRGNLGFGWASAFSDLTPNGRTT